MRVTAAIILIASLTWSAAAQNGPLSPEAAQIIEKARELALEYTANLPNLAFRPLHAQLNVTIQDGTETRNEMEFGNYRKFTTEATLNFEP